MAEYQLLENDGFILRQVDGATIPTDPDNQDYIAYLAWIEQGGVPDPYVAPTYATTSVTPRQIRLALSKLGLRQVIEDWVNTQPIEVQDSWHYSLDFEIDNPLIVNAVSAMGKSQADLVGLFTLAASL